MSAPFSDRMARVRAQMHRIGIDALLVGPSADLRYLTGYAAPPLERLTMLVLPSDGDAVLVVPELERPLAEQHVAGGVAEIVSWSETDDPYAHVRSAVPAAGSRLAVGERLWATFLLRLQETFPHASFSGSSAVVRALRACKDDAEVDALRRAGAAADNVAVALSGEKGSGRSEREVSRWIIDALSAEGTEKVNFAIVASGPNAASPHHEPGERILEHGDALVCDFGGSIDGYCSDITRTFVVGEAPEGFAEAYAVLAEAQDAAVSAVKPGVAAASIDAAARDVIASAGYGDAFIHRTGHGIGLEEHEEPYIVAGNEQAIEAGMAFSIEPGIYRAGRFGMRIEDIVVATTDGVERLNSAPRNPVVLA